MIASIVKWTFFVGGIMSLFAIFDGVEFDVLISFILLLSAAIIDAIQSKSDNSDQ